MYGIMDNFRYISFFVIGVHYFFNSIAFPGFVAFNDVIKRLIKATLARQLYDDNAFEEIINKSDIMIDDVILLSQDNPEETTN